MVSLLIIACKSPQSIVNLLTNKKEFIGLDKNFSGEWAVNSCTLANSSKSLEIKYSKH